MIRDNIGRVEPRIASAARESNGHDQVVLGTGRDEGLVELGVQEQLSGQEADGDRNCRGDNERYDGFQRDDPPQHRHRDASQPQDAERTFALGESRRDSDGEAAAGDRQAHDVGQLLVPGEEAIGVRVRRREGVRRKPTRNGVLKLRARRLDRRR